MPIENEFVNKATNPPIKQIIPEINNSQNQEAFDFDIHLLLFGLAILLKVNLNSVWNLITNITAITKIVEENNLRELDCQYYILKQLHLASAQQNH
jgi:hypothetical protein